MKTRTEREARVHEMEPIVQATTTRFAKLVRAVSRGERFRQFGVTVSVEGGKLSTCRFSANESLKPADLAGRGE